MFKVEKISKNKVNIQYNTKTGFKNITLDYNKPLFTVAPDNKGSYHNLDKSVSYELDPDGAIYPYECFRADDTGYDKGLYFNTLHLLDNSVFDEVVFPNYIFYDIETDYNSLPVKKSINGGVPSYFTPDTAVINSIAWIDSEDNEYVLVKSVDGSEKEILEKFLNYLTNNNITSCIGFNSRDFDDILLRDRLRYYNLENNLFKRSTNQNNLDVLVLANLFNYINLDLKKDKMSLNDVCKVLGVDDSKLELDLNPILLYHESIKNNDFTKFKEYNIQDVRLTRDCFNIMNSVDILSKLFNLTKCPLNKMDSQVAMLNHYTCNLLYNNKVLIPTINNPEIGFKNSGGHNKEIEKHKLVKVDNVVCFDIVSYYPHLFYLIKSNNLYDYPNFNTDTGELTKFGNNLKHGFLSDIAIGLYDKRAEVKNLMKKEKDSIKKQQYNYEQKTLKILVNSLYGACGSSYGYILGSHKIASLITLIGRNLLTHLIDKYPVVYAKTDSIFVQVKDISNHSYIETLLKEINNEVTNYLKETYNLNNYKLDGSHIIRFEIDSIMNKLVARSKGEYIKIFPDGSTEFKGSVFTGAKSSEFEKDLVGFILKDNFNMKDVFKFTDKVINEKPLDYFSKKIKLSSKTPDYGYCIGRYYMENNNIPYSWDFKYNGVRVESNKYDWVLYPAGYKVEDLKISPHYAYSLAISYMFNTHMISKKEKQEYFKNKTLIDGISINKYDKIQDETINNQYKKEKTKQVNNTLDVYQEKEKSVIKNEDRFKSKKLQELCELIPDTKKYVTKELVKIVPFNKKEKPYMKKKVGKYLGVEHYHNKDHAELVPSGLLCEENDNIGILPNVNNLYYLDIDGDPHNLTKEDNKLLCDNLMEILEGSGVEFVTYKGKTKGYHMIYNGDVISFKGFRFPEDYFIKSLAGKLMGSNIIESEEMINKPTALPPSTTSKGLKYDIIPNKYKWDIIFNNPVNNNDCIRKALIEKGFTYTEPVENKTSIKRGFHKHYNNHKPVQHDLINERYDNVLIMCKKLLQLADTINSKYYTAFYLGGQLTYYINKKSARYLCDDIIEDIGDIFDEPDKFKDTVLNNYGEEGHLAGFNKLIEKHFYIDDNDPDSVERYNSAIYYCDEIIKNCRNLPKNIEVPYYGYTQDNSNYELIGWKVNSKYNDNKYSFHKIICYCTFESIERVIAFNPKTQRLEDDKKTLYNFSICNNNLPDNKITYNHITIDDFIIKLDNLDLLPARIDTSKNDLKKFIHNLDKTNYIPKIEKPYPYGLYAYKGKIIENAPYLNSNYDLIKGLEVFKKLVYDVFLKKPEYTSILNYGLLLSLCSVLKSLKIQQDVNRYLIICGVGGVFKTLCVMCTTGLFDSEYCFYETSGADSMSSLYRQLDLDTLALEIHDSDIDFSDSKNKVSLKSITNGFVPNVLADSSFGNEINARDAYRTIISTTNKKTEDLKIDKDDGEDRRSYVLYLDESFKPNTKQIEAVIDLLNFDKDNIPYLLINNISVIGAEFWQHIKESLTIEKLNKGYRKKIKNTNGFIIIKDFWEHINEITNYEFNDLCMVMSEPFLNLDYTINRNVEVNECFRKDFKEHTNKPVIYNDENISTWLENSPLFSTSDNKDYDNNYGLNKIEYNNMINKNIKTNKTPEILLKNLFNDVNIDDFKNHNAKKGFGRKQMVIFTKKEIVKYLLNVKNDLIIEDCT